MSVNQTNARIADNNYSSSVFGAEEESAGYVSVNLGTLSKTTTRQKTSLFRNGDSSSSPFPWLMAVDISFVSCCLLCVVANTYFALAHYRVRKRPTVVQYSM